MSFARVYSAQPDILKGTIVPVEFDISRGLNSFSVVGLADKAIDEAKDRVGAALKNSGFESPKNKNQKTTVSLAPASLKKEGTYFDLAIAIGYLLASEEIDFDAEGKLFIGELALNGEVKKVTGILPVIKSALEDGYKEAYVPEGNAEEAALIRGIKIYPVKNFSELYDHLHIIKKVKAQGETPEQIFNKKNILIQPESKIDFYPKINLTDMLDIRGQENAKRALEIAAAGRHNIALYGPPGTGKTMLARAFTGVLPPLEFDDALTVTGIHSVSGTLTETFITHPPFRSPHHSSSYVSIIGGGANPKPGEVTLAHQGVLFLDEFPEFEKRVLESLREPLEDNVVSISRARGRAIFPSNFILIAAMNPCPCGFRGSTVKPCTCMPRSIEQYAKKLSGPIVDRIDLWVSVSDIDYKKLASKNPTGVSSSIMRENIKRARDIQKNRLGTNKTNSDMSARDIEKHINLDEKLTKLLELSATRLGLSGRSYHRILKIARTIADLENSLEIKEPHLLEALQYRPKINQ